MQQSNPWDKTLEKLRETLGEHSFKNWFSQTRFHAVEDGCLSVRVPSQFFADWLKDHYQEAVTECAKECVPNLREVRFIVAEVPPAHTDGPEKTATDGRVSVNQRTRKTSPSDWRFEALNPRYVFDRFVVGSSNRFAHAAAKAVAENPARAYNPLFLYGGTGLGKTHLMQAIGHELLERYPDSCAVFISSEHFTNQLIESIAKKATARFRARYRKVDVLLIDDIQFIAGKEATQEEFFHTFNWLFDKHKQIVIASDRQPKDIPGLEERLVSRFEWGLVTDIQPPDLETRVAILQSRAAEERHPIPPDVLRYIATYVTTNIRELEGALITLLAYSRLNRQPVTLALAEEVLGDIIGRERAKPVTIETVQRVVAEHFDLRIADLRGRNRQRQVSTPRQIAMYLSKTMLTNVSLSEIGEAFGGKDHTTVLYACGKIAKDVEKNPELRQLIAQLQRRIKS